MKEYKGVQKQKHFHGLRIMFHIIYKRNTLLYRRNPFHFKESNKGNDPFRKTFWDDIERKRTFLASIKKAFRKYIENMEK